MFSVAVTEIQTCQQLVLELFTFMRILPALIHRPPKGDPKEGSDPNMSLKHHLITQNIKYHSGSSLLDPLLGDGDSSYDSGLKYGQFSQFHVCVCGLDSGNLKFETARTNKQHILLLGFETLNLKFCDLKL